MGWRFLAATDGTTLGDHALTVARALARQAGAEVIRLSVQAGLPGVEIARRAETWGASLVVMGRHPASPEWPHSLGSTSDVVLRRRNGYCLFVPPHIQTVSRAVIALDGGLRGLGVLTPGIEFLNLFRAAAGVICVLPGARESGCDPGLALDPRNELVTAMIDAVHLDSGPCELTVCRGGPVAEVLRAIRDSAADLLILGVRRGGKPGDSGSGYVGRELLRSAPCAILSIPV